MRFCWRLGQLNNAYLEVVLKCVKASECPQHGVTAVVTPVPLPPFFLLHFCRPEPLGVRDGKDPGLRYFVTRKVRTEVCYTFRAATLFLTLTRAVFCFGSSQEPRKRWKRGERVRFALSSP